MCMYDPGFMYNPLYTQEKNPWTGREWEKDPLEVVMERRLFYNLRFLEWVLEIKIPNDLVNEISRTIADYYRARGISPTPI